MTPLTDADRDLLAFERQWWKHAGAKVQAIRELFGIGATTYYQRLNRIMDDPAALEHDPLLVGRLRRQRQVRRERRYRRPIQRRA